MNTTIEKFHLIGLAVRTTNENGKAAQDIPQLWQRFLAGNIPALIPGRANNDIYCVYTAYEKDHTKPYTTVLGCRVEHLEEIPDGLTGITVEGGTYVPFIAKGKITDGIVFSEWTKIWNSELARTYTADFEVYGDKAQNPDEAEVEIFIAVK